MKKTLILMTIMVVMFVGISGCTTEVPEATLIDGVSNELVYSALSAAEGKVATRELSSAISIAEEDLYGFPWTDSAGTTAVEFLEGGAIRMWVPGLGFPETDPFVPCTYTIPTEGEFTITFPDGFVNTGVYFMIQPDALGFSVFYENGNDYLVTVGPDFPADPDDWEYFSRPSYADAALFVSADPWIDIDETSIGMDDSIWFYADGTGQSTFNPWVPDPVPTTWSITPEFGCEIVIPALDNYTWTGYFFTVDLVGADHRFLITHTGNPGGTSGDDYSIAYQEK